MLKQSSKIEQFILAKDEYTKDRMMENGCHFVCMQDGFFLLTNELDANRRKAFKFDNSLSFSYTDRLTF